MTPAMMRGPRVARNPKVNGASSGGPNWYGYYAGYSADFVNDVLADLGAGEKDFVLDPWNGAGTTTDVAASMGLRAIGFDLNPVMVLVARARLLDASVLESLPALTEEVVENTSELPDCRLEPDPLEAWIAPASCAHLRRVERGIQRVLVNHTTYEPLAQSDRLNDVSSLAAFFYVALFDVVKVLIKRFRPTNPAWVKFPESPQARIRPTQRAIDEEFRQAVRRLAGGIKVRVSDVQRGSGVVLQGNARALPLDDASIKVVLTSPPYCTRIDYVVTTLGELAVMGYDPRGPEIQALRREMLGTPTMDGKHSSEVMPGEAAKTLAAISRHASVASATYYRRCFEQYFSQLLASLREIRRVVTSSGVCGVVVQDSYYKDVHIDLQQITVDLAASSGWSLGHRHDFRVPHTKAAMNPRTRVYRQRFDAVESLLTLRAA